MEPGAKPVLRGAAAALAASLAEGAGAGPLEAGGGLHSLLAGPAYL